jgi:glucosamine 6-phosphate synthetase-like amidotransferase/phosphosugar isomerase protein
VTKTSHPGNTTNLSTTKPIVRTPIPLSIRRGVARGGPTYVVTHVGEALPNAVEGVIEVPKSQPELDALLLNIPLQLLAYHVALAKGCDIEPAA